MASQVNEAYAVLALSQLITFGVFSVKVFWTYKKELGQAQQQIDELKEDVNNLGKMLREYKYLNNQNIGHIQDFLSDKTDYKPPTLTSIGERRKN
ncbi:MAG: hypothetical protein ACOVOV_02905 [Dolichospermum sp.]